MDLSGLAQTPGQEKSSDLDAFFSFEGLRPNNPDRIYDLNFLKDSTYVFLKDQEDHWQLDRRHLYDYDNQGRMILDLLDTYVNGKWHPSATGEMTYTDDGLLKNRLISNWSSETKQFEDHQREHFYYNIMGEVVEKLIEVRSEVAWQPSQRKLYQYNSAYLKSHETLFEWNREKFNWDPYMRTLYEYNSKENLSSETVQIWVDTLQTWVNQYTREFTYDSADKLVGSTRSSWSHDLGQWVGHSFVALSYNDKGQLETTEQFLLNNEDETEGFQSIEAEYDDNGNLDYTLYQEWNSEEEGWEPYERHSHFWSEYLTGNLYDSKEEVQCFYANPYTVGLPWYCEGLLDNATYTLTIYDLEGRMHHQQVIGGGDTFRPAGKLEPGFYLVVINGGLTIHTEKVLVQN